ncbi:hypothetical protein F4804DRAFT_350017 [Jackrogersella minutella]|nr:hypothetical protein F4804DRAFT_350017 [Jackrogersella minutella]
MTGNWTAPAPHGSSSGSSQLAKPQGPPYASTNAIVGGEPTPAIDDPIAAIFLLLFVVSALAHIAILRINKARHLKFVFSGMLFALCLLRSISLVARMVWASYPKDVNAVIAASVMTQCGSVLIFIINLFFAQRVLRAYHPRLGWHRGASAAVWFLIACVLCCLVMAIVSTIHSFFTLSARGRRADRAVQLFAGSYLAFLAFLPVPVVALAAATHPRRFHVEKFGAGRWRSKVGLLVFAALVATVGAAFRVGVNFDGRPGADPAWFHSRACYYGFNFVTDLVVSTAYLFARFDKRFIVPDGARGPGEYSPIIPTTNSRSNLVGKLPLMGNSKPLSIMRPPPAPPTPPSPPQTTAVNTTMAPSPSSSQQHLTGFNTDSSNTAVQNTPTASRSFNHHSKAARPNLHLTLKYHSQHLAKGGGGGKHAAAASKPSRTGLKARSRRAVLLRMRINSEADAYGPDASSRDAGPLVRSTSQEALVGPDRDDDDDGDVSVPAPAYFVGPPILPDLDLDLELLSATLLAPWALDSWGFDVRRSSRSGSASSKRSHNSINSSSRPDNSSNSSSSNSSGGADPTKSPRFFAPRNYEYRGIGQKGRAVAYEMASELCILLDITIS